jgi:chromosome segregation ATPase
MGWESLLRERVANLKDRLSECDRANDKRRQELYYLRRKVRAKEEELHYAAHYEAVLEQRLSDLQSDNEMLRAEKEKLESEVEQLKITLKGA